MSMYVPETVDEAPHLDELTPREIVEEAMRIAGKICIYTNDNVSIEEL